MPACEIERPPLRPRFVRGAVAQHEISLPVRPRPAAEPSTSTGLRATRWLRPIVQNFFPCLWLFIGAVSSVDAALTVKYQHELVYMELNPVARTLLRVNDWDPSVMIGVKFAGTILVLGILIMQHRRDQRIGHFLTAVVAMFQLGLLWFLIGS
jgi:hypothetical protein